MASLVNLSISITLDKPRHYFKVLPKTPKYSNTKKIITFTRWRCKPKTPLTIFFQPITAHHAQWVCACVIVLANGNTPTAAIMEIQGYRTDNTREQEGRTIFTFHNLFRSFCLFFFTVRIHRSFVDVRLYSSCDGYVFAQYIAAEYYFLNQVKKKERG